MLSTADCQYTFLMLTSTVGNYCSFLLSLCTFVMCDSIVGVYCWYLLINIAGPILLLSGRCLLLTVSVASRWCQLLGGY